MTDEKKSRLFIRNLKSVGLVDAGANRGAHLLISKRHDEDDEIDAATPAEKSLLRKTLDVILGKQANVGNLFESLIHRDFTVNADQWFGDGMLTREERIALSNSIGAALDAFRSNLEEVAPELYERAPWDEPLETVTMSESASTLRKEEGALPEAREENQMPETPGLDSEIRDQLPEEARKYLDEIEARLVDAEDSSKAEEEVAPDLSKREDLPEDVRGAILVPDHLRR